MKKSSKPPESQSIPLPPAQETVLTGAGTQDPTNGSGVDQRALFDQAMTLFHRGQFSEAREKFLSASQGANREMGHAARLHVSMCDQRLARLAPQLETAEDHYNYAIALINRRQLNDADRHLRTAAGMLPDADHLLYALALVRALQGDLDSSCEFLRRAIEIDGRNRSLARSDPDFQEFCRRSPLRELVNPPA